MLKKLWWTHLIDDNSVGNHVGWARKIRKLLPLSHRTAATQNHRHRKKSDRGSSQIIKRPGPTRSVRNSVAASLRLRSNYGVCTLIKRFRIWFECVTLATMPGLDLRNFLSAKTRQELWRTKWFGTFDWFVERDLVVVDGGRWRRTNCNVKCTIGEYKRFIIYIWRVSDRNSNRVVYLGRGKPQRSLLWAKYYFAAWKQGKVGLYLSFK